MTALALVLSILALVLAVVSLWVITILHTGAEAITQQINRLERELGIVEQSEKNTKK